MNKNDFFECLKVEADKLNINLTDEQILMFYKYMQELINWNEKINLTAITQPKEIIIRHFIDSLTILPYINKRVKVLDIGTGAGFPGIPLNIANNESNYILVDSLNKRIQFLDKIIEELKLKNISTIHARAEELAQNAEYREEIDIVVSRAVAPLNYLSEYMLPFLKKGGIAISMKGSNAEEEIRQSQNALGILGGKIKEVKKLILPGQTIERTIITIEKVKDTPRKYPRKAGIPKKQPL